MSLNKDFITHAVTNGMSPADMAGTNGSFGENVRVHLELNVDGVKGHREFTVSDGYTLAGQTKVVMTGILSDHQGIAADLVDDTGTIKPEAVLVAMRETGTFSPMDLTIFSRELANASWADSQDSLLYNMLVSAMLADWYSNHGGKNCDALVPRYSNGHVAIDRAAMMGVTQLTEPSEALWALDGGFGDIWTADDYHAYAKQEITRPVRVRPVINTAAMRTVDAAWVVAHLTGRHRTTNLAFDVEIPQLATQVHYVGAEIRDVDYERMHAFVTSPRDAWRALDAYVTNNRLGAAFARVWHMMCQVSVNVLPQHAEAHTWLRMRPTLTLPNFAAMRGVGNWLYRERAYQHTPDAVLNPTAARRMGGGIFTIAARYKALALWGVYRFARRVGPAWDGEALRVGERSAFGFGPAEMPALIAYATGRSVPTPLLGEQGLTLGVDDVVESMFSHDWITVQVLAQPLTGFVSRTIEAVTQVCCGGPQWPGGTAAAIGQEWLVCRGTALYPESSSRVAVDERSAIVDVGQDLDNLAAYYRWAGYNLHLQATGEVQWVAFAPNTDSTVPTVLLPVPAPADVHRVRILQSEQRAKWFIPLPPIHKQHAMEAKATITRKHSWWCPSLGTRLVAPRVNLPTGCAPAIAMVAKLPGIGGVGVATGYITVGPDADLTGEMGFQVALAHGPTMPPQASLPPGEPPGPEPPGDAEPPLSD